MYCLLLTFFLFPGLAFTQWSSDPSQNTPVVTAPETQGSHKIVHDSHGGYFVVWHDSRDFATTGQDIYAQYFNPAGEPQWGANGTVVSNANDEQSHPKITPDGIGGIIVSWQDERGTDTDIYAQRLDANGAPQWTPNGIPVIATTGTDYCGWLVSDGLGGAIVMSYEGAVNRVAAAGFTLGDADDPLWYSTSGNSGEPKLMADDAGGAILTWVEDTDIAVQHVDDKGTLLWNSGNPVLLTNTGSSRCPRIISDGSEGAIIMWQDERSGPGVYQIYAQRVDSNGTPQGTPNDIQVTAADTYQYEHGLASDGAGGAFVTWFDEADDNLYAQRIVPAGSLPWASAAQLTTASDFSDTSDPPRKTVEDGSGGFITVWLNDTDEIRAQRVDGSGTALWAAGGVVLSNVAFPKNCPRIEGNGQGGAVAIWGDGRNDVTTGHDIDMQGVNASGALGDPGFVEPAATYDATGTWDYTTTNNWASGSIPACNPQADETGTVTITQTGNNFTLVVDGDTFTGTVSGATYTIFSSETEAGETETLYITFTLSSSSSGSGSITWAGTDGVEWCEGGAELTFTKQAATVTTGSATSVTSSSATLNGTVNPNGFSTTYYFDYGTTTSYGSSTASANAGSGTSDVLVSADVIGLSANTAYHVRIVATNSAGTSYGSDQSFTTLTGGGGDDGGGGDGGCFIATAAYGSPMGRHVKLLRDFRDRFLLTNPMGRAIIYLYSTYSPSVADFIARHDALCLMVRWSLLPLVSVSWMALNIGLSVTLLFMGLLICFICASATIALRRIQLRSQV